MAPGRWPVQASGNGGLSAMTWTRKIPTPYTLGRLEHPRRGPEGQSRITRPPVAKSIRAIGYISLFLCHLAFVVNRPQAPGTA